MSRTTYAAVTAVVALLLSLLSFSAPAAAFIDRDCGDFATQADAQRFFLSAGGPSRDPHRLDSDGDGMACETLPCPCYWSTDVPGGQPPAKPKPKKTLVHYGRVTRVVDGDTVDVRTRGTVRRVRLIGIDTPEVYGGAECWGREASAAAKRMLPVGTRVKLTSDNTQARVDAYGRILRYITRRSDNKDINRLLIARGHAAHYVYANKPFKRVKGYRTAQRIAMNRDRGMWGAC